MPVGKNIFMSFVLCLTFSAFATDGPDANLLSLCSVNRIDPSFSSSQILTGKVDCIYGHFIQTLGGRDTVVLEVFKNGKFRAARAQLVAAKLEIDKLGVLSTDDQLTIKAIEEVLAPKALPPPSPTMTLGGLRDFHIQFLLRRN